MSQKEECINRTSFFCDYLGISRQGYYQHKQTESELDVLITSIVLYCLYVRKHQLPRAGMRELYVMCKQKFGKKMTIGRDRCFDVFRANGFAQRKLRRPRTTNSNHNYYIYPDMLNTSPKLVATEVGQLVVGDITYVATNSGWAYLSLLTDAASRMIVGWNLERTLETSGPMGALNMSLDFYSSHNIDLSKMIHHSDRGIQYCSYAYTDKLKEYGIMISMTQTGDPLHNALAERMNNTIKNGWLFECADKSFEQVNELIARAIYAYNNVRPHQALNMQTPSERMLSLMQN